ncbi:MAG: hypothetical protein H2212_03440 [Ruminococcus sp.]|nr:hypothetical protein [Ruminococcus sp.]
MKGFMEEYGGVIAACILGLSILGMITFSITSDGAGTLMELAKAFFKGVGSTIVRR